MQTLAYTSHVWHCMSKCLQFCLYPLKKITKKRNYSKSVLLNVLNTKIVTFLYIESPVLPAQLVHLM